jgi:hypothetical protein
MKLPKGSVKEKTGYQAKITGIHIDIPDGSLKLGISGIAPAGRIQAKRISAETLQDNNHKKQRNTGGGRKQNRLQVHTGKDEAEEEQQIAELGYQSFATHGCSVPPGFRSIRTEQATEDNPQKKQSAEEQGEARHPGNGRECFLSAPAGGNKPASDIKAETNKRNAAQQGHKSPFIQGNPGIGEALQEREKPQPQTGGQCHTVSVFCLFLLHNEAPFRCFSSMFMLK